MYVNLFVILHAGPCNSALASCQSVSVAKGDNDFQAAISALCKVLAKRWGASSAASPRSAGHTLLRPGETIQHRLGRRRAVPDHDIINIDDHIAGVRGSCITGLDLHLQVILQPVGRAKHPRNVHPVGKLAKRPAQAAIPHGVPTPGWHLGQRPEGCHSSRRCPRRKRHQPSCQTQR